MVSVKIHHLRKEHSPTLPVRNPGTAPVEKQNGVPITGTPLFLA